jgi:predicted HTH domain antitoxin
MLMPGDVVTALFIYSDASGRKVRPALVVSSAVGLYVQEKISLGTAAQLAGMSYMGFWQYLTEFDAGPRYAVKHLEEDVETLKELKLL